MGNMKPYFIGDAYVMCKLRLFDDKIWVNFVCNKKQTLSFYTFLTKCFPKKFPLFEIQSHLLNWRRSLSFNWIYIIVKTVASIAFHFAFCLVRLTNTTGLARALIFSLSLHIITSQAKTINMWDRLIDPSIDRPIICLRKRMTWDTPRSILLSFVRITDATFGIKIVLLLLCWHFDLFDKTNEQLKSRSYVRSDEREKRQTSSFRVIYFRKHFSLWCCCSVIRSRAQLERNNNKNYKQQ